MIDFRNPVSVKFDHTRSTSNQNQIHLDHSSCRNENVLDDEIVNVLNSVTVLMKRYRMYSKASEANVCAGGLQQYLIRKLKQRDTEIDKYQLQALYLKDSSTVSVNVSQSCDRMETSSETKLEFCHLPIDIRLYIFSHLAAKDLCRVCSVSKDWSELAVDDLLWQDRLQHDLPKWNCISHTGNPKLYTEVQSEWSPKEIYLRCSPEVQQYHKEENTAFHQVSQVLKYLLPKKVPKAAIFGPGMESSTSAIVRKMLYEENEEFTRMAMFPGQFDGVGSGMTLKLQSGLSFHLSVLYTASKEERGIENRNRLAGNRMLNRQRNSDDESESYELHSSIRHFCHTLDAFIFVVDASQSKDEVKDAHAELFAMVSERWSSPQVPLLVLSCTKDDQSHRTPAIDVVEALQLSTFNRPWLVQDATVDSLKGVVNGIQWLVEQSQHR